MIRVCFIGLLWLIGSNSLCAQTLGLSFWVDAQLGQTSVQKQILENRLNQQVGELNAYFRNSQVDLSANIVNIHYVSIEHSDAVEILGDMVAERNGFAGLFAKADEDGADYSFAIVDNLMLQGQQNCGRGFAVNKTLNEITSLRRAVAVVSSRCGTQTLAHELGHLLGLNHGVLVDACIPGKGHKTALTPYAQGYALGNCDQTPQSGEFGTIMVGGYLREINGDGHGNLPLFSNPLLKDVRCGKQGVCGDAEYADAARVMNDNKQVYAGHASPDVHRVRYDSSALAKCIAERYRFLEIEELLELICPNAGIDNLEGIQQLIYLERIDLSGNPLIDASQLTILNADQIKWIKLSSTRLSSASIRQLIEYFAGKMRVSSH